MENTRPLAVVILAAGQGKRMGNPAQAKVLADLNGKPLLGYVLEQSSRLLATTTVVIVGHQREAVAGFVAQAYPQAVCVVQDKQLGTGHAVMQTAPFLAHTDTDVLILSGDVPLLKHTSLEGLLSHHRSTRAVATVVTANVPNPFGYGRILKDAQGKLVAIVEHKDATEEQREISEINSGIYLVRSEALYPALERVGNTNAQGEFYLTDIVGILQKDNNHIESWCVPHWEEVHGINTVDDLQRAWEILEQRSAT